MAMFMVTNGIITQFTDVSPKIIKYICTDISTSFFSRVMTLFHVNLHGESTATRSHAYATYLQTWFSSGTAFHCMPFHNTVT